ncbi:MAG: cobyric acid synthase [Deltaproteobacteria bacterium]|nr:cobyric acid synthase [Deltaproteobacteria bacterium]
MADCIMIQGTGSHVGKSVLTAALCRIFKEDGTNVAPFKSQNMALNSFVTEEGGEMGRAQVVQAEAAGLKPHVDMNPILIKPHADMEAQVIIHGKVVGNYSAKDFHGFKKKAMKYVKESYDRLSGKHDLIVIEGAGSPAEINLRENDIANMGTAHLAGAPVILVGDIDKGGVFASLVGTLELLDDADRERIKGFIINKFRGDISLLKPGLDFLEKKTGLPVLGVIPYFRDIYIQEEDSVNLDNRKDVETCRRDVSPDKNSAIEIVVLYLPHISNFTDFDPFASEADVNVRYVTFGERIGEADLIIIPGSKSTIADLHSLKSSGYADEIAAHVDHGGKLIGICGGYQMLGKAISDPQGVEGRGSIEGLGYLDIKTVMNREKMTQQVEAIGVKGSIYKENEKPLKGYEIHMGESFYIGGARPLFEIIRRGRQTMTVYDGASARKGQIWGTYMHGIFDNDDFRRTLLDKIRREKGIVSNSDTNSHDAAKEEGFRKLAELVRENLDLEKVYEIVRID